MSENQESNSNTSQSLLEAQKERQYQYWETVYSREFRFFEWIGDWATEIRPLVSEYLHPAKKVLHIGCGNSKMSEQLLDDNFDEVINLDFSPQIINTMKEHYKDNPKLSWIIGDCADLPFSDESFDYVFDKSALDAITCGERFQESVPNTFKEVTRVLKSNGYFILSSLGMFESNDAYLNLASNLKLQRRISFLPNGASSTHFVYIYQKE